MARFKASYSDKIYILDRLTVSLNSGRLVSIGRMPAAAIVDWLAPLPYDSTTVSEVISGIGGISKDPHQGFRLADLHDALRDGRIARYRSNLEAALQDPTPAQLIMMQGDLTQ